MSDESADQNTQYGNIEQIKADLFELKQAVADLEAKTEPLQNVTNAFNVVAQLEMDFDGLRQRMDALSAKMLEMDGRYAVKLGALEQRLDAMDAGKIEAWLASQIDAKIAALSQRIDAMDKMGKVGQ